MTSMNISGDYTALETYFIQRLVNTTNSLEMKSIVWEEVFSNGVQIQTDTIVHVWKLGQHPDVMNNVILFYIS